jgi:hypothetical protein
MRPLLRKFVVLRHANPTFSWVFCIFGQEATDSLLRTCLVNGQATCNIKAVPSRLCSSESSAIHEFFQLTLDEWQQMSVGTRRSKLKVMFSDSDDNPSLRRHIFTDEHLGISLSLSGCLQLIDLLLGFWSSLIVLQEAYTCIRPFPLRASDITSLLFWKGNVPAPPGWDKATWDIYMSDSESFQLQINREMFDAHPCLALVTLEDLNALSGAQRVLLYLPLVDPRPEIVNQIMKDSREPSITPYLDSLGAYMKALDCLGRSSRLVVRSAYDVLAQVCPKSKVFYPLMHRTMSLRMFRSIPVWRRR